MLESPFSKRVIFITCLLSVCIILAIFVSQYYRRETKIVFCDVGQGDGTYIRLENKIDIVIDAGPDSSILQCLGRHMPFYDRKIEYAFISHPQKDHFGGLIYILDRYKIKSIWMSPLNNEAKLFSQFKEALKDKKILVKFPVVNDKIIIGNGSIKILWPQADYINENSVLDAKTDPTFLVTGHDLNEFSLIFRLEINGVNIFFTGDAPSHILNRLLNQDISNITILKIPHHGSKNGLSKDFLELAQPAIAVISVGKDNSYGHPSSEVLDMLKAADVKIRRTDLEGDVVFKLSN